MVLRLIKRGTQLSIIDRSAQDEDSGVYEALFHDMHDVVKGTSFIIQCSKLNRNYDKIGPNAVLEISYVEGPSIYKFTGRIAGKTYTDMLIIEQLSEIEELNRRIYQRDEIRVEVKIFGIPEGEINSEKFVIPSLKPTLSDVSFDVSAGGMCIITNAALKSEHDPYYIMEFSLSEKDQFLLPAKIVRRSNHPRTKIGRHDYGFQFIFDNLPNEKSRLTKAILSKKLSFYSR